MFKKRITTSKADIKGTGMCNMLNWILKRGLEIGCGKRWTTLKKKETLECLNGNGMRLHCLREALWSCTQALTARKYMYNSVLICDLKF